MSALADRKLTTIAIYEVRYWDYSTRTTSPVRYWEERADAVADCRRLNASGRTTGSRYHLAEHVLHLKQP